MASNCTDDGNGCRVQSEVAGSSATCSKVDSQLAVEIEEGTWFEGSQGGSSEEGSPVDGCNPGIRNEDITETPAPGPEGEGEGNLTLTAFWRVLADAGYDVW